MHLIQQLTQSPQPLIISYALLPKLPGSGIVRPMWVQAVVAVVQAALEMSKSQRFEKWQSEVSDKLDAILTALFEIQQQLRDFRVWSDERISEETRRQYSSRISSLVGDVNNILVAIGTKQKNKPTPDQLKDLNDNFRDLRLTISDLTTTDGYSHIMSVACGCVATLPLFGLMKRDSEMAGWARTLSLYLASAISANPAHTKSLEWARNVHAADFMSRKALIDSRLNCFWMTNYRSAKHGHFDEDGNWRSGGSPSHYTMQKAGGSIEDGILLTGREGKDGPGNPPWYPELPEHYDEGDGADKSWQNMYHNLEAHRQYAIAVARKVAALAETIQSVGSVKESLDKAL